MTIRLNSWDNPFEPPKTPFRVHCCDESEAGYACQCNMLLALKEEIDQAKVVSAEEIDRASRVSLSDQLDRANQRCMALSDRCGELEAELKAAHAEIGRLTLGGRYLTNDVQKMKRFK